MKVACSNYIFKRNYGTVFKLSCYFETDSGLDGVKLKSMEKKIIFEVVGNVWRLVDSLKIQKESSFCTSSHALNTFECYSIITSQM
jgi:hypothetical protein